MQLNGLTGRNTVLVENGNERNAQNCFKVFGLTACFNLRLFLKGLQAPKTSPRDEMEGGSPRQQGDMAGILDREHPGLHQVHHVES